jgi:plastocyanin
MRIDLRYERTDERGGCHLTRAARVACVVAIVLAWAWNPGAAQAHGPTVEISHSEIEPALLNLFVGTTVHFLNTVEMPGGHVIVEKEGRLESPPLEHPGDDWHYTFEEEGVYEIFVRQHPSAKARIVVVPRRSTPGP